MNKKDKAFEKWRIKGEALLEELEYATRPLSQRELLEKLGMAYSEKNKRDLRARREFVNANFRTFEKLIGIGKDGYKIIISPGEMKEHYMTMVAGAIQAIKSANLDYSNFIGSISDTLAFDIGVADKIFTKSIRFLEEIKEEETK